MKKLEIRSIVVRKFRYQREKVTSDERKNLLNQDFTTTAINQNWCTDITYIYTKCNQLFNTTGCTSCLVVQ